MCSSDLHCLLFRALVRVVTPLLAFVALHLTEIPLVRWVVVASIASIVVIVAPVAIMVVAITSIVLVFISSTMVIAPMLVVVRASIIIMVSSDLLVRSRTMATMIVLPLVVLRLLLLALKNDSFVDELLVVLNENY